MKTKKRAALFALALAAASVRAAFVPPAGDFDILIYTRWQFVHDWKTGDVRAKGAYHHLSTEAGAKELDAFLRTKYRTFVTADPRVFELEAFRRCKCVIFQCTNHEQFLTDAQRNAFYAWARNGGGTVAIHSASANERGRKEWLEFLGGAFVFHYSKHMSVPFRGADRSHPAITVLPEDYVWAGDEIYVHQMTKDATPLLVFANATVPAAQKAWVKSRFKGVAPAILNGDHPIEWVKNYGKGRVFYTALGHNPKDFKKPEWKRHVQAAAEWTMAGGSVETKGVVANVPVADVALSASSAHVEKTVGGARLVQDGRTVWELCAVNRESKPFVHPMCLPDGRVFTAARPADHPWHLGLWFCWKLINGVNYWEPQGDLKNELLPAGLTVLKSSDIAVKGAGCTFKASLWYGPRAEAGRVLLEESRVWEFLPPDEKGGYKVRAKHVFAAREKVTLDGRRPVSYGGLGLRMSEIMKGCLVRVDGKEVRPKKNGAVASGAKELAYVGPSSGHGVSVRLLSPLPTERIYMWANRGYMNPVPFYDRPIELEKGETMALEYEVSVF